MILSFKFQIDDFMIAKFKYMIANCQVLLAGILVGGMMLLAAPAYGDGADQEQMIKDLKRMSTTPMRSTSYMVSSRPIHIAQPQNASTNMPKASGSVITYFGSRETPKQRVWVGDLLYLSGQNLMSTGSRYSRGTELNTNVASVNSLSHPGRPRKVNPDDPVPGPFEEPVGDAALPLMLLACVYLLMRRRVVKS